jgi:hypothetical protein
VVASPIAQFDASHSSIIGEKAADTAAVPLNCTPNRTTRMAMLTPMTMVGVTCATPTCRPDTALTTASKGVAQHGAGAGGEGGS